MPDPLPNKVGRAYSLIEIKALDADERVIEGVASTPTPDRMGDIVEPMGAKFSVPMPLLWQHNSGEPVGHVEFAEANEDGINFRARFAQIDEPGELKNSVDKAWQAVKAKLVRAVSIGFSAIEMSFLDNGGIRFMEWDWLELSLVTIPANSEATISTVRSIDRELRAASGQLERSVAEGQPCAEGKSKPQSVRLTKMSERKTYTEQIASLEATRAAKAARMEELMQKSVDEGRSTDEAEAEEFDTLEREIASLDADLKRFRVLEANAKAKAVEPAGGSAADASASRGGHDSIRITSPKGEKGVRFARMTKCIGMAKGNFGDAHRIAEQRYSDDQGIQNILKAAVAAGTTSDATWAGPLVGDETSVFADFVEFLRPMTILGRFGTNGVPALRQVPFRVPLITQSSGGAGYWVGEGAAKPLTQMDFARTTLEPLKVANIAVVTEEVLRDSSPSAEVLLRDQLAAALRERLDTDFIDPAKAAVAGVSPASITNGVTPVNSSGDDADSVRADIRALFNAFIAANNAPTTGVWVMPATTALALSLLQNPLGQPEFPGITMTGGTFFGLPVVVSEYVPTVTTVPADPADGAFVVLLNATDIYLGDDGGISVDMSREASLEMADNPTGTSATPTAASLVSLWQTNSVGFRAERTINWQLRRPTAVQMLDQVTWGG